MKVAIIGATSQSTPALFRALAKSSVVAEMRFSLVARSLNRLKLVSRAIDIVANGAFDPQCHEFSQSGLAAAISGAGVVIIQVRFGGLEGRLFDETFPLHFGICGDEGLGPGGLSAAWRTWPHLSELLGLVRKLSPAAMVLLLTSPGSLLARLAGIRWPDLQVLPFCELPMTTLHKAGGSVRKYDYLGINHLGWIYGLPNLGPIPLKYWRLHTEPESVIAEQRRIGARALELQRLTAAAFEAFANGGRQQIEQAIDGRPAPWYSEALGPLLESLITRDSRFHFFFSEPNRGWSRQFSDSDVMEIPYWWKNGNMCRKEIRISPPHELEDQLKPFIYYEHAAAQAVLSRQRSDVEHALTLHPWVSTRSQAIGLARAIVTGRLSSEEAA